MANDSRIARFTALPRTEKLYHHNLWRTEAECVVVKQVENLVALEETLFYAESGGQVADLGFIDGAEVTNVKKVGGSPFLLPNGESIKVDTVFVHELDPEGPVPTFSPGQKVHCRLDWDHRFQNMQMHTLAHLMFVAAGELLSERGEERNTLGCYIDSYRSRFDFLNSFDHDDATEIECRVNKRLAEGGTATVTPINGADDAYIWRLGEIEIPCGGTHVNDLSQIEGEISVSRRSKGKGKVRLTVTLQRPNDR
ncbi:alanyl-tRNA editing protein [Haloglycomyces albus]|uniref:alanyl-tRNA editing protein n=1 Tax=Haloglycomyces albus TaxID=526067 RepID=UPI00046C9421|nr:alanyl-tRNA editing protein [Haloglycomyces albus]